MNCWHCGTELIWGGDHDLDDYEDMDYDIITNLSSPSSKGADLLVSTRFCWLIASAYASDIIKSYYFNFSTTNLVNKTNCVITVLLLRTNFLNASPNTSTSLSLI